MILLISKVAMSHKKINDRRILIVHRQNETKYPEHVCITDNVCVNQLASTNCRLVSL